MFPIEYGIFILEYLPVAAQLLFRYFRGCREACPEKFREG